MGVGFCFWAVSVVLNVVTTMENSSYFSSVPDIIITSPIFESTEDSIPSIFVTTSLYQEEDDIADDRPPIDQTLLTVAEDNERFVTEKTVEGELAVSSLLDAEPCWRFPVRARPRHVRRVSGPVV